MENINKEKVLFIYNGAFALANFKSELIYKIIDQGHEVFLLVPYGKELEPLIQYGCKHIDLDIDRRDLGLRKNIKLVHDIRKVVKHVNPSKVITYTIKCNVFGGIVCRQMNIPYFVNITGLGSMFHTGSIKESMFLMLYRYAIKNAKSVFFQNETNMKYFISKSVVKEQQCVLTFGSGVNLDKFKRTDFKDDGVINFLFSGRIMKEKGIDELLTAIETIKVKHQETVKFQLTGFYEEDYSTVLIEMEKKGLLEYSGFQGDIKSFINASDCVILPSYHEGMSNILLEAGAMRKPLIASDIPGCREIIIDKKSGYLVKPMSSSDLTEKIELFIMMSSSAREAMADASYEHVVRNFDREEVNELIYKNVFKESRS